jgi:hypothetical protein
VTQHPTGQSGAGSAKPRLFVSIPHERCKPLLDTDIFAALKARYDIHIFSYLADSPAIRQFYAGPGVTFHPEPKFRSRWRWRLYNFTEILRHFAFLHRWRHGATKLFWHAETLYQWVSPEHFKTKRPVRKAILTVLAWLERAFGMRRIIVGLAGPWMFRNAELQRLFERLEPAGYIGTAHKTDQEKVLAYFAGRYGVRSIFLPDSTDNFSVNGGSFHDFDYYCMWGPRMYAQARALHDLPPEKLVKLGIPAHRTYERLVGPRSGYDLHERYDIPRSHRIVTYLSIWRLGFLDMFPSIDYLLAAIESGRLKDVTILIRTSPWEDPTEILQAYGGREHVRVQVSGNDSKPDFPGVAHQLEYAETMRQSDVVVASTTTTPIFLACRFGRPSIANMVELSEYPAEGLRPSTLETADALGFFEDGLPAAHTLHELVDLVDFYLKNPQSNEVTWRRVGSSWDYGEPDHVPMFLSLLPGAREDRPAAPLGRAVGQRAEMTDS